MKYHFLLFSIHFLYTSSVFSMDATPVIKSYVTRENLGPILIQSDLYFGLLNDNYIRTKIIKYIFPPRSLLQRSPATNNLIPDTIRMLLQQYAEGNNSKKIISVDPKYQLSLKRLDPTTPPVPIRTRSNSLSKSLEPGIHYNKQFLLPRTHSLQSTPDSRISTSSGSVIEIDQNLVDKLAELVEVHGSDSIENNLTEEQRKVFEKAKSESPRKFETAQAVFVAKKRSSTSDLFALQRTIPDPNHKPKGLVKESSSGRRTPVRRNSLLGDAVRPQSPLRNSSDSPVDTDKNH